MPKPLTRDDVRRGLNAWLSEVTGVDLASLPEDARLAEMGIESLDLLEAGMMAEEHLDIRLSESSFDQVETIGDVVSMIWRLGSTHD